MNTAHISNRALTTLREELGGTTWASTYAAVLEWDCYLSDSFGYEALNDGAYSADEITHARTVLARWLQVFA